MTRRTAAAAPADVSRRRIEAADRAGKRKPRAAMTTIDGIHNWLTPALARVAEPPEPVDTSHVNWRKTRPWERPLVQTARERERQRELSLFTGLTG